MFCHCDIFHCRSTIFACVLIFLAHSYVDGGAVSLTQKNIDSIIATNELVFINFYAEWCRFSNILAPIFDEAANKVTALFPNPGKVVMGKVNCDVERHVASTFSITKYPTLKVIRNQKPSKREYRGQRSVEAFVDFVKKQLEDPIKEFSSLQELQNLDNRKRMIIGFYDDKEVDEYTVFQHVATNLKDDCQFYIGFGNTSQPMHPPGENIVVFRSDKAVSNDNDEAYTGSLLNYEQLNNWAQEKCVPLVREITFENAEELTEEGLPFLILFHAPNDVESIKKYKGVVAKWLKDEKHKINFLTADGDKFAHPLHHLNKGMSDLPLIAIDSFRHMYLFPKFEDIEVEEKLKGFLKDLYTGKLHREYHYGPDPEMNEPTEINRQAKSQTTPPESTFKKLAPSKNRYTLLRDEL